VKIYLDGDTAHPTLCGTGTEDYIGTAWGQGAYADRYQGCPLADQERYQYGFYRLHIPDPIHFQQNLRVTIQQIGCWGPDAIAQLHGLGRKLRSGDTLYDMEKVDLSGYGLFERQDDWSSCAWFYLDRPENGLPPLAPVAERTAPSRNGPFDRSPFLVDGWQVSSLQPAGDIASAPSLALAENAGWTPASSMSTDCEVPMASSIWHADWRSPRQGNGHCWSVMTAGYGCSSTAVRSPWPAAL